LADAQLGAAKAEAPHLTLGTTDLAWRPFLSVLSLGNLGLALDYVADGSVARRQDKLSLALAARR